jgi:hypothetical protein
MNFRACLRDALELLRTCISYSGPFRLPLEMEAYSEEH